MTTPAPTPLLKPSAVARRLGIARPTVYAIAKAGHLTAVPSPDGGFARFSEQEVETFRQTYRPTRRARRRVGTQQRCIDGALSAAVFRAFDRGATLVQIVEELAVAPATVRQLWKEYRTTLSAGDAEEIARRDAAEQREHERRRRREEAEVRRAAEKRAERVAKRTPAPATMPAPPKGAAA